MTRPAPVPLVDGIDYRAVFDVPRKPAVYDEDFDVSIDAELDRLATGSVVIEYGAGANPRLASRPRVSGGELRYYRVDISRVELDKSVEVGTPVLGDACDPAFSLPEPADLAVSRMLAEHVASGEAFLRTVHRNLAPGGRYVQISPVLFALPFVANRVLPERLGDRILQVVAPRGNRFQHEKFPSTYSLCRGPSPRHLARLGSLGFEVEAARGYFGHWYYDRIPGLRNLERIKARWLREHPVAQGCSFALYVLRKR